MSNPPYFPRTDSNVASVPAYLDHLDVYHTEPNFQVSSPSHQCLVSPSEEYFITGFYPPTPTLSLPDTPTTTDAGSSAPPTPDTPYFGPTSPEYAYAKNEEGLNVPGSHLKTTLLQSSAPRPAFEFSRVGVVDDQLPRFGRQQDGEDGGQELVIPGPRSRLFAPFKLQRACLPLDNTNKVRTPREYEAINSTHSRCDLGSVNNSPDVHTGDADASKISASTTTNMDESLDISMFEIITPTQELGFDLLEPALAERPRSMVSPVPADTPPRTSTCFTEDACAASVEPPSPLATPRAGPLLIRRHRPPPISVSQDLNTLVRRPHGLRSRDSRPSTPASSCLFRSSSYAQRPSDAKTSEHPLHDSVLDRSISKILARPCAPEIPPHIKKPAHPSVSESPTHSSASTTPPNAHICTFPNLPAALAPAGSSAWFPPPGPGSPKRFFADSPVPLTPVPDTSPQFSEASATPTGELRRHRPSSVRSISPMALGESLLGAVGENESVSFLDVEIEEMRPRANPREVRSHRRQLAISFSVQTFEDFDVAAAPQSFFSTPSPPPSPTASSFVEDDLMWPDIHVPVPQMTKEPELMVIVSEEVVSEKEEENVTQAQPEVKKGGFWKRLGASASGLFSRQEKAPKNDTKPKPSAPPKKRGLGLSISEYFRRSDSDALAQPQPYIVTPRREVWPSPHRRTPGCSDPTCFFHPRRPAPPQDSDSETLSPLLACSPPSYASGFELGDDEGTFLHDLGAWGIDIDLERGEASSVREDGERMLKGILSVSSGVAPGSGI